MSDERKSGKTAVDEKIADLESRLFQMKPDDPDLPAVRRLLDSLKALSPRRILDLRRKKG